MKLSEVSIRRPVFATVLSLLVVLIGLVSFTKLSVREYPKIDEPVVTVSVRYVGASAEVMESQVTKPLEDSIAGIDAVDVITSISRAEQAQITVRFRLEKDADSAAAEVRDRTSRVRNKLPQAVDEPVIAKVEADAFPVIWLSFTSDTLSGLQINDLVNRIVKPRLQTVTGAADVRIFGERKYAMRVWLDPDKLAAYKLTTQDAEDAIRRSNLEVPAGRIESTQREFSVTSQTDLTRPSQFADIIIKNANGFPVRIRDVGRVQEAAADERSGSRLNGKVAITAGVIRQATANPLELSRGVRAMIPKLKADLPPGISIDVANDNSVFIDKSIQSVFQTILEAIVLVALVIFVFLRTVRASIIPIVTIPVCLVGTFALMALAGFTINTLTLLALVLAIGLVVDDAIVVLENIYRHIEEGMDPFSASIKGGARGWLRSRGHDADAGGGLCAAGIHAGAHRSPVHRVCPRIGRGRGRFGFHRPDAVADDVFGAAAPQPESELVRQPHGALAQCPDGGLPTGADLAGDHTLRPQPVTGGCRSFVAQDDDGCTLDRDRRHGAFGHRYRDRAARDETRTVAAGGPGAGAGGGHGTGWRHAGLHQSLCRRHRTHGPALQGV
jgi:preprotein translocase subunit SecF